MFAHPSKRKITNAWKTTFTLNEIVRGAYLCVALEGEHGKEGAYASMKVAGKLYGAPSRAPSYPGMPWEHTIVSTPKNNTYFFPLSPDMVGRQYEVYVLCLDGASTNFEADVWITAYPPPWEIKTLLLK